MSTMDSGLAMSHKTHSADVADLPTISCGESDGRDELDNLSHLITDGYEFKGEDLQKLRQDVVYVWVGADSRRDA